VLCDASKRTSTDLLLKAQYNRRSAKDIATLPEGKIFKYITYTANVRDPMPPRLSDLKCLRIRQQQFQEKHTTSVVPGVVELDLPLDFGSEGVLSLRMLLLGTRCRMNVIHPLFLSIDYNSYHDYVTALFHVGNSDEASRLLSALPVVLEARYGSKIWTWFTQELRAELAPFHWDPVKHCLVQTGRDHDDLMGGLYSRETFSDWEQVDSLNLPDAPSDHVAIDISLLFDLSPRCGGEGYDENASLATMKTGTSNATGLAFALPPDLPSALDVPKEDSPTVASSLSNGSAPPPGASGQGAGVPLSTG
jgi:hypothetical protein